MACLASGEMIVALRRLALIALAIGCMLGHGVAAAAPVPADKVPDRQDPIPEQVAAVGVDEHLDQPLPLDLRFRDETGRNVRLGDYFDAELPVILTLNYSDCPMLCSLELNGLVDGLKQLEWKLGEQYRIVTVSIDPSETPEKAARTKQRYLRQYDRPGTDSGWHFLVGGEPQIRQLADAVGFRYRYVPDKQEYYHAAALALVTPNGRIGRYLYGVEYHPRTLRLALTETGEGKIGSAMDQLILYCSMFDPKEGSYALVASRVMSLGGAVAFVLLAAFLGVLWSAEIRKRRRDRAAD
jgi:protein SCO1